MDTCYIKRKKRIVPWKTSEEWRKVYTSVFSKNIEKKRWACNLMRSWSCKFTNDLSLGVKLTMLLTEALLLDHSNQKTSNVNEEVTFTPKKNVKESFLTPSQVSVQYSYAITRFVNDLLESMQDKQYAISLTRLARKTKMPVRLVELRHECTHGEMASIEEWRRAAVLALMFLKKQYWDAQIFHYNDAKNVLNSNKESNVMEEKTDDEDDDNDINDDEEVDYKEEWVDEDDFYAKYSHYIQESMGKVLEAYCECSKNIKETKLSSTMKSVLNDVEVFLQTDSKLALSCISNCKDFLNSIHSTNEIAKEWKPLVEVLVQCDVLADMMLCLLKQIADDDDEWCADDAQVEKIMLWCLVLAKEAGKSRGQSNMFERGKELVINVVAHYNKFTPELLPLLIPYCVPVLSKEKEDLIKNFAHKLHMINTGVELEADVESNGEHKDGNRVTDGNVNFQNVTKDKTHKRVHNGNEISEKVSNAKKPKIFMLLGVPDNLPGGIKPASFYETLHRVPCHTL